MQLISFRQFGKFKTQLTSSLNCDFLGPFPTLSHQIYSILIQEASKKRTENSNKCD